MSHMHKRHEGMGKRMGARGSEETPSKYAYAREDQSKNAGVPTEVKIVHMSQNDGDFLTERYDDTVKGIDARMAQSASKLKGKFSAGGRKA